MTLKNSQIISITLLLLASLSSPAIAQEWPMSGANPQRTSWVSQGTEGNLKELWVKPFIPYIRQKTQLIGANGHIYVSTQDGLYAINANTGDVAWVFGTTSPLGNSPTYSNGVLYVGDTDRSLYAINANTGQLIWRNTSAQGAIETNPLVVNNLVIFGSRDGNIYALDLQGDLQWTKSTAAPVLFSPAYDDSTNTVYTSSMDGYAYAINANTGDEVWKSLLPGEGTHSWWPVVYQDPYLNHTWVLFTKTNDYEAVNTPELGASYGGLRDLENDWLFSSNNTSGETPGTPPAVIASESSWSKGHKVSDITVNSHGRTITSYFETYPQRRNLIFLDASTGAEKSFDINNNGKPDYAPMLWAWTHEGTQYPPVIDGNTGTLYFRTTMLSSGAIPSAMLVGWKTGGKYVSFPISGMSGNSSDWPSDEPVAVSMGGNMFYWNLCCDRFLGAANNAIANTAYPGNTPGRQWRYNSGYIPFHSPSSRTNTLPGGDYHTNPLFPQNSYFEEFIKFMTAPHTNTYERWHVEHGDNVAPIPYQGRLYVVRGNSLIAFDPAGAGSTAPVLSKVPRPSSKQPPTSPSANQLVNQLNQQVAKIIAAGHLKPFRTYSGLLDARLTLYDQKYFQDLWSNPAETIIILARALPYLSETLRHQTIDYIKAEYQNYNPLEIYHVGFSSGKPRHNYPMPPDLAATLFPANPQSVGSYRGLLSNPVQNIYAAYIYAKIGVDYPSSGIISPSQILSQINTSWLTPPANVSLADYPNARNAYLAANIGYAELKKLAGQSLAPAEQSRLDSLIEQTGNMKADAFPSGQAYYTTLINAWNFMYLNPEMATALLQNATYKNNIAQVISRYQEMSPYWHIPLNTEVQGENGLMPYQQTHAMFQAKALLQQASQSELWHYLDSPYVETGDLYYIDNLVATIASSDTIAPPEEIAPPDLDANGAVNIFDINTLINNFLSFGFSAYRIIINSLSL
ncbi:MAG: hypothetical protein D6698_09285 [Gammaproteobacteria bacterium]|nr:MAG: hypothetical protein D6698_09285 [Gammaproteobacteria bacterium]